MKARTGLVPLAFTAALAVFAAPSRDVSQMLKLQPVGRLVSVDRSHHYSELGGQQRQPMDCAGGSGGGKLLNLGKLPVNTQSAGFHA